jgi:hypothetical protein
VEFGNYLRVWPIYNIEDRCHGQIINYLQSSPVTGLERECEIKTTISLVLDMGWL